MSRPTPRLHVCNLISVRFKTLPLSISCAQLFEHCSGKVTQGDVAALRSSQSASPWAPPVEKRSGSRAKPADVMKPTFFDFVVKPCLPMGMTNSARGRLRRMVDTLEAAAVMSVMLRFQEPKPSCTLMDLRDAWLSAFDEVRRELDRQAAKDAQARSRGGVNRHAGSRLLEEVTMRMMLKLSGEGWCNKSGLAKKLAPRLARLARRLRLTVSWTVKARRDAVLRLLSEEGGDCEALFKAHCLPDASPQADR